MIPLSVDAIFNYIEDTPSREFVLRVCYLEIYNEISASVCLVASPSLVVLADGWFVQSMTCWTRATPT